MAKSDTSIHGARPIPSPPRAETLNRILRQVARLVRHGTVSIAVDVSVLVAPANDVVAALAQDRPGGPAEHLLALLVPEDDPVGGIDREDGLSAPRDLVEGFRWCGHGMRRNQRISVSRSTASFGSDHSLSSSLLPAPRRRAPRRSRPHFGTRSRCAHGKEKDHGTPLARTAQTDRRLEYVGKTISWRRGGRTIVEPHA